MKPPPELRPLSKFDPAQPAILHDGLSNKIIPGTGKQQDRFRNEATYRSDGTVQWDGHLLDGWGNVLGG